ncbi:ABC transporter substrate-binding protein [Devosia sp.]|uniref:ABC transporter substrate-binding protein n=1 Tax=Devosia sp. TaxID=1871048 RepID=UPI003A91CB02
MMTPKLVLLAGLTLASLMAPARAEEPLHLTLGLQESGTVQWEIAAMQSLGLDAAHGIELDVRPLADSRAGQIALLTGTVDVILSDFVWVSTQRDTGNMVTMVPHSLAVGGLMVPEGSAMTGLPGLAGKTIGVAGGPVDKSWVILKAYYNFETGDALEDKVSARFGAPPLINELLASGGIDSGLNFWHWNARAKAMGMKEVLPVSRMLQGLGVAETPPLLGWSFSDETAAEKTEALTRFLDASFATKQALLEEDGIWAGLVDLMRAESDATLFSALRDDYRAGIVTHYNPNDVTAAEQTFALLAEYGGSDLVGDAETLAPGTFWAGYTK